MAYGQSMARGYVNAREVREGTAPARVTVSTDRYMVTGVDRERCPVCGQTLIAANYDDEGSVQCAECGEWVTPEGA